MDPLRRHRCERVRSDMLHRVGHHQKPHSHALHEAARERFHGHAHHVGKVPPYLEGEVRTERELDELRRQMDQAVQDEEFEQAARLRDRIRELTREQNADSGSADQKEGNADAGE